MCLMLSEKGCRRNEVSITCILRNGKTLGSKSRPRASTPSSSIEAPSPAHKPNCLPIPRKSSDRINMSAQKLAASASRQINAVVVSAGLMEKTVKVRIGQQKWNAHIRKASSPTDQVHFLGSTFMISSFPSALCDLSQPNLKFRG